MLTEKKSIYKYKFKSELNMLWNSRKTILFTKENKENLEFTFIFGNE